MYIWHNTRTGEKIENENNFISIGTSSYGTVAYLGNSNVVLFELKGYATEEEMDEEFESTEWEITKKDQ